METTFHKIFILLILFSAVIGGWTSILLISNTTLTPEIKEVINKMYLNQKNFVLNVKDLSFLLVKDANDRLSESNHDITQLNNIKNNFLD